MLVPEKNGRNINDAFGVVRHKNDAVPAYSPAVPPLPAPAFERDDVASKGVVTHLTQPFADECLLILRKASKLSCGVSGEPDGPSHVLRLQGLRIRRGESALRLHARSLLLPA